MLVSVGEGRGRDRELRGKDVGGEGQGVEGEMGEERQ